MNIPSSIATMLVGIILTLVSIWFGQNHGLLPVAASQEAPLIDNLFNAMMTISVGLFLIVQGVIIYSAIRFRRRSGDNTDGPPVHGNVPLEILWTAIPAVIVLGISIYSFDIYNEIGGLNPMNHSFAHAHKGAAIAAPLTQTGSETLTATSADDSLTDSLTETEAEAAAVGQLESYSQPETENQQLQEQATQDPATAAVRNEAIPQLKEAPETGVSAPKIGPTPDKQGMPAEYVINVTGLQYAWLFTYPEGGIVSGELHLPVGREVKLNISANDVIHAFWVPEFRLKQDAVPGRQTELRFTPDRTGTYPVICAELCGAYHGAMKTQAIVETPAEFSEWIQSQQVAGKESPTIAANPLDQTPEEFLSPYVEEMGINSTMLEQVSQTHHSHTHHPVHSAYSAS